VCTNVAGEGSSLRNSFRKLRPYSSESGGAGAGTAMINNNEEVAGIYLQTFAHHWAACQDRLQAYEPLRETLVSCLWKTPVLALENPGLSSGSPGLVFKKTMSWLWKPRVSF
jgi:hypothetical protein